DMAIIWRKQNAKMLHIVDLDAALTGEMVNFEKIKATISSARFVRSSRVSKMPFAKVWDEHDTPSSFPSRWLSALARASNACLAATYSPQSSA
ncbi:HisA/HisF-related TIM barrel protein, partial [uncultured Thiodictyon sp.]|uniref:HisA/HisF-related TIM barrel protein n=1 Tax=uncultured Thiodictyon sp. TaxID=1846217 RepID=UPI0025DAA4D2